MLVNLLQDEKMGIGKLLNLGAFSTFVLREFMDCVSHDSGLDVCVLHTVEELTLRFVDLMAACLLYLLEVLDVITEELPLRGARKEVPCCTKFWLTAEAGHIRSG